MLEGVQELKPSEEFDAGTGGVGARFLVLIAESDEKFRMNKRRRCAELVTVDSRSVTLDFTGAICHLAAAISC
jgi:hypothetical protein